MQDMNKKIFPKSKKLLANKRSVNPIIANLKMETIQEVEADESKLGQSFIQVGDVVEVIKP